MFKHENFLISKMKFVRLIYKIMQKYFNENLRIQSAVLNVLQKIMKMFFFYFSLICALFFRIILQLLIHLQWQIA